MSRSSGRPDVVPAVNHVELHPVFTQRAVREANVHHGIVTEAWSSVATGRRGLTSSTAVLIGRSAALWQAH